MSHGDSEYDTVQNPDGSSRNTVVFFHENAGNLGLRLDYFSFLYHDMGVNVIAFAYRGYSDSVLLAGFPTENSIKQDARIIMSYLVQYKQLSDGPMFAVGRSLGGAVAAYAALIEPEVLDGLVLENTFTSIPDMVDSLFYLVGYFKPLVLRIKWDTK
jgi:pimeloyl-ACP methyl ester carboxylesterase